MYFGDAMQSLLVKIKHCNAPEYGRVISVFGCDCGFRLNTSQQSCGIRLEYVRRSRNSSNQRFPGKAFVGFTGFIFCLSYINFYNYAATFYIGGIIFELLNYFKRDALGKGINKVQRPVCFPHSRLLLKSLCQPVQRVQSCLTPLKEMNYSTASAPAAPHSYPWAVLLEWSAPLHGEASVTGRNVNV